MRLIDADEFEVLSWDATGDTSYDQGFDDGALFVTGKIDAAPTIDAIPVEWMVSWINRHPNDLRCAWFASLEMEWQKEQEAR